MTEPVPVTLWSVECERTTHHDHETRDRYRPEPKCPECGAVAFVVKVKETKK